MAPPHSKGELVLHPSVTEKALGDILLKIHRQDAQRARKGNAGYGIFGGD